MVHLAPLPGTEPPDSRGDYGYALYRGIMPQGGATLEQAASVKHYLMKEPLSGDEMLHYRFTSRKKEAVDFDTAGSGMMAYFCTRYENQKGDFGSGSGNDFMYAGPGISGGVFCPGLKAPEFPWIMVKDFGALFANGDKVLDPNPQRAG
jgi:hypothetical protein